MAENSGLTDRYLRRGQLGHGAMGDVWLADDQLLHRAVAIKQLRPAGDGSEQLGLDRIVREARLAARLSHPNAVGVYDLVVESGQPYVVMEYVAGDTLADRIRATGGVGLESARSIIGQVAAALDAAHSVGIVHRDVKPSNILITDRGVAKLADFGIARQTGDTSITQTGLVIGTPSYLAPEVARGAPPSPASDVWSLGATLFAAIEGGPPFDENNRDPLAVLVRIVSQPAPLAEHAGPYQGLLARMLEQQPTKRPAAADVVAALTSGGDGRPARAQPGSTRTLPPARPVPPASELTGPTVAHQPPVPPARPPSTPATLLSPAAPRRRRLVWPIAAAAAVVLAAAVVTTLLLTRGGQGTHAQHTTTPPSTSRSTAARSSQQSAPSTTPTTQPTSAPANPMNAAAMQRFVSDYYALIPGDLHTAFGRLGPGLKAQGFAAYQNWWSRFSKVNVTPLNADAAAGTVTIRLSAVAAGTGSVTSDTEQLTLITSPDGHGLLINSGQVVNN